MLNGKEKVALFDFCETLVDFQTADAFVDFVRLKSKSKRMFFLHYLHLFFLLFRIIRLLTLLFPKSSINKRFKLIQFLGMSKNELDYYAERYYIESIKPRFIKKTHNKLIELQNSGYRIMIVSGGYDIYLKFFAADHGLSCGDIISTKLKFVRNRCLGIFDGKDCLGDNKVFQLNRIFDKSTIFSIAFSDSQGDLPFLKWANIGYIVRRQNKASWNSDNQLNEIIW